MTNNDTGWMECQDDSVSKTWIMVKILFCSILFYSILFYSILFYSILFLKHFT